MKKILLLTALLTFSIPFFISAQNLRELFQKPLEANPEPWLDKMHYDEHNFVPRGEMPSIFDNLNISAETHPQNEPSVKISRKDPNRVVAAWRDFRTGVSPALRRIGYSYSTDGGQTWSVSQLTPQIIPTCALSSDPAVATDTAGNFYIVTVSLNDNNGNGELWLFKSVDGGVTFDSVYQLAYNPGVFEDKEYVTTDFSSASPYYNNMYVSWTRFGSGTDIYLVKSTDQGVSWSTPIQISNQSGVQGSIPATGPNGEVYVAWYGSDFSSENIYFDKSTDGGVTFGTDKVISPCPNAWFPSMAVDLSGGQYNGNIYVTWNDERNGDGDIFLSKSTDGGETWSAALRINNDPVSNGRDQYWPWITVAESGEVDLIFYDTRNTANNSIIEAYLARSTDGGQTFTNELISTQPSPTSTPNSDVRFGDYIGIDAYGGNIVVPVWTDERAGGTDMDIYTAVINNVPVELVSFNGRSSQGKNLLEWQTSTEKNNRGFEVERSTDGSHYLTRGFVEGGGTTEQPHSYSFSDEGVNGEVYYRLKQIDFNGRYNYSNIIELSSTSSPDYHLAQNYPNPFNPTTMISYSIPNDGNVSLKIYDVLGKEIKTLVNGYQQAGIHSINFAASGLSSGIYFYKMEAGSFSTIKKMLLLR
ncbi:MAG TPA: T9SS type A sorting domain-containing protein [Ignavibacteriaceae bacterium]|nr:T9SS type A sorting domain-containing protein [Ignavibacteriaceae bacterium]